MTTQPLSDDLYARLEALLTEATLGPQTIATLGPLTIALVNALPKILTDHAEQAAEIQRLREVVEVGQRFLAKAYSAWAAGEPEHRVKDMVNAADAFRAALNGKDGDR